MAVAGILLEVVLINMVEPRAVVYMLHNSVMHYELLLHAVSNSDIRLSFF